LVVDVLMLLDLGCCSETFVSYFIFSFLAVCIRTAIRVLRYCKGWV
jgi:hypothetical protein